MNINVLSDFVKNAEILWFKGAMSVPQVARNSGLFKVMPIPQMTGNTREFSEVDLEEYASKKAESDQSSRAKVQQGYTKIGTLTRISKDIGISYELRTQGKYEQMKQNLTNLGKLAPNRIDLDLTHRFTFGTDTTYVDRDGDTINIAVGDGLALFATNHTLRGSSTTYRNLLANNPQFSPGSLDAMLTMRKSNTFNQFGEKMTISDDVIFSTDDPTTVRAIQETLRSSSNNTQNNSGVVNVYQGAMRHVVLPRLATDRNGAPDSTKSKYWGVASTELSSAYLGVHEEPRLKTPTVGSNAEDFSTDDWNFGTRAGYMVVVAGATWAALSKGDGTA